MSPSTQEKYGKLSDCLGFLLAMSHDRAYEAANTLLKPLGVHPRHVRILLTISEDAGLNQHTIAEKIGVHRNVMVALTDQLEEKHLVKRAANPDNRREYLVQITSRGRRVLSQAKVLAQTAHDNVLSEFSKTEAAELLRLLQKFLSV